eukprot:TRINITY_DN78075_c0_g1_i1.p2 TRINITY_DN78075_c0_g1~~TRINITY_DN78075_c0_g1_i1.p2  ORF type:complete len:189 (-),score=19.73 TRINITY_DN78075_c0_g1_i1:271-837(-)
MHILSCCGRILWHYGLPRQSYHRAVLTLGSPTHWSQTSDQSVHLSSIGHPLIADETYGIQAFKHIDWCPRMFLHCRRVQLHDLAGNVFSAEAALPEDLATALAALQEASNDQLQLHSVGEYRTALCTHAAYDADEDRADATEHSQTPESQDTASDRPRSRDINPSMLDVQALGLGVIILLSCLLTCLR